jgi:hypothetical protein
MIKFGQNLCPGFFNTLQKIFIFIKNLFDREDKKGREDQGSAVLSTGAYFYRM